MNRPGQRASDSLESKSTYAAAVPTKRMDTSDAQAPDRAGIYDYELWCPGTL